MWFMTLSPNVLNTEIMVEVIKTFPSFLWFLLICVILFMFYDELKMLLNKLKGVEIGDVKLSFEIEKSIDAAIKLAEKDPQWSEVVVPEKDKVRVAKRASKDKILLDGARFLWVDDHPENNNNERRMYQELGVFVDFAESTESAVAKIRNHKYDCVISDMLRGDNPKAGLDMLNELKKERFTLPVIIYLGVYDPNKGVPPGAFGITNRPDELLHLTLDVMARKS